MLRYNHPCHKLADALHQMERRNIIKTSLLHHKGKKHIILFSITDLDQIKTDRPVSTFLSIPATSFAATLS